MRIEKIAVKNERPGTLPVPALRTPEEGDFEVPSTDTQVPAADQSERK